MDLPSELMIFQGGADLKPSISAQGVLKAMAARDGEK